MGGQVEEGEHVAVSRKKLSSTSWPSAMSRICSAHRSCPGPDARAGTGRTRDGRSPPSPRVVSRHTPHPGSARTRGSPHGPQPHLERRHRLRRVLVDQRGSASPCRSARRRRRSGRATPAAPRPWVDGVGLGDVARPRWWTRARWSALFTDASLVPSSSATSVACQRSDVAQQQHRPLTRRQVLQRGDEGQADRSREPRRVRRGRCRAARARRASAAPTPIRAAIAQPGCRRATARSRSMGRARRFRPLSMSRHTLVAMR